MTVFASDKGHFYGYTADTLAEFVRRLELLKPEAPKHRLYFRGLSDMKYNLSPSIGRPISQKSKTIWLSRESRLVEFAEQSIPELFTKSLPTILLSNMQHYGIPTRMLDITENALVALYFACCDNDSEDGKVVVFEGTPVSAYNPYVNIIADTYRLTNDLEIEIDQYRYLIYHQEYASGLLYSGWETDENDGLIEKVSKPLFVDVGNINARQKNQTGKFILFPNKIDGNLVKKELEIIDNLDDLVLAIIRIPKESKQRIRKQFGLLGMTDGFIFPDDITKVFNGVKDKLADE